MLCKICEKPINQLQGRKRTRCNSCNTRLRRLRNKIKAIKLLGGKCSRCGFDKHLSALEFHHIDKETKKFNVGRHINKSWDTVKEEVSKCILLCSNCHKVEHSTRYDDKKLLEIL